MSKRNTDISEMNYQKTLEYLYNRLPAFQKIGADAYKPGLERVGKLLKEFDNPHQKYKVIHVGGTNGKGSVSNLLASVLQSAGYKTGLYTSPHLVDFGERIRVNGEMIEENYVVDFVEENKLLIEEVDVSFFEATMSMAFRYFADCNVDVAVVEVGLGGRLDSTNVVLPELSIITNIGYDHTQFLGDSLPEIAKEKAGIIKEDVPVVIGERNQKTDCVFLSESQKKNSSLIFAEDVKVGLVKDREKFCIQRKEITICPEFQAQYQQKNIRTALVAMEVLIDKGFHISDEAIKLGLGNVTKNTHFQGRWQVVQHAPKIIIDTAHNSHGMEYAVSELKKEKYDKLFVLLGMVDDKDAERVLALLPKDANYFFTTIKSKRTIKAEEIETIAREKGLKGQIYSDSEDAFNSILEKADNDDLIFITGSNYLVGEIIPLLKIGE